jgi:hypothetical protein
MDSLTRYTILQIDRAPTLDDNVTIHYKYSNPPRMHNYPLAQAKDLFHTLIASHIFMMSGRNKPDPKLRWAVDYWKSISTANISEGNMNNQHNLMDLDIYLIYVLELATKELN